MSARSSAGEPTLSMHRVGHHVKFPRDDDPDCLATLAVAVNSASQPVRGAPGIEPWRFRDAFGAAWGTPIRVPSGGRKQFGRTAG